MSFRIERGQIIPSSNQQIQNRGSSKVDFQTLLQESLQKNESIKISAHAEQRMQERNIVLQDKDMDALKDAMNDLDKKGARESLMIYKNMAFIASVRNRTIITTMKESEMDIVTNIDSIIRIGKK